MLVSPHMQRSVLIFPFPLYLCFPPCVVETLRSGAGLPPKNSLLSSIYGSMMTVTTLAEEEGNKAQEEVGRVGGWVASFDKLLEDPLGVVCLQVSTTQTHAYALYMFPEEIALKLPV